MYHPDDDGGDLQARMDAETNFTCCGGIEDHKPWCAEEGDEDAEDDELFEV